MDRQYTLQQILGSALAANGKMSRSFNGESFRNIELELAQVGFTGTIKFAGSNADAEPDFASAASLTNPWDYIKTINLIDGSSVAGGTGVSGTATTSITQLEVNSNGMKWINAVISGYSAGSITLKAKGYNNL